MDAKFTGENDLTTSRERMVTNPLEDGGGKGDYAKIVETKFHGIRDIHGNGRRGEESANARRLLADAKGRII
jgi:hypothetical protein